MCVIASRDLKKYDELTIAFMDVNQYPSETVLDSRRRKRERMEILLYVNGVARRGNLWRYWRI